MNDLNDLLLIIFCRLTDCFSITVEGNTLAVVYLSHNCRTQADVIFVNAELNPIHQSAGHHNNWTEPLKPVGALMVHIQLSTIK